MRKELRELIDSGNPDEAKRLALQFLNEDREALRRERENMSKFRIGGGMIPLFCSFVVDAERDYDEVLILTENWEQRRRYELGLLEHL